MTAAAVLLSAALAVLTVCEERKGADPRLNGKIDRALGFSGLILTVLAVVLTLVLSFKSGGLRSESFRAALIGYVCLAGGVFSAVMLSLSLSALLRRIDRGKASTDRTQNRRAERRRGVRIALSVTASAVCLLLSTLWIVLTRGSDPDPSPVFALCGIGFALILRFPLLAERTA